MKSKQQVGAMIRQFRESQNLTREEIGQALGVSGRTFYWYETGQYYPGYEVLSGLIQMGMDAGVMR
jgi:transcriptional regulator with XRE-family HTH domain